MEHHQARWHVIRSQPTQPEPRRRIRCGTADGTCVPIAMDRHGAIGAHRASRGRESLRAQRLLCETASHGRCAENTCGRALDWHGSARRRRRAPCAGRRRHCPWRRARRFSDVYGTPLNRRLRNVPVAMGRCHPVHRASHRTGGVRGCESAASECRRSWRTFPLEARRTR